MRFGGLLILFTLLAAAASPAAGAKASCAKAGRTLLKGSAVRVYDVAKQRVYACHLETRRRTFLTRHRSAADDPEDLRGFVRPRLAGRFVAFGDEFGCDRLGDCGGRVRVVDARTGRDRYETTSVIVPAGTANAGRPPTLPVLRLKASGAAVYLIGPTADQPYELWRLDADGVNRLDAGNVDPASIATNDARVYWMRDGQTFTAAWR